ncbi:uncharacterized protein DFL_007404 [Arthrobotrys flagrans]|uniref:Uncharacterized protein n=1 Tax=Arthrobotrys flagrans TaxID=97331 RepID=A0A436ZVP7_ARTFL|nr:hypothetical protein DFL_007404 [Arthrobotrys flagrans]
MLSSVFQRCLEQPLLDKNRTLRERFLLEKVDDSKPEPDHFDADSSCSLIFAAALNWLILEPGFCLPKFLNAPFITIPDSHALQGSINVPIRSGQD